MDMNTTNHTHAAAHVTAGLFGIGLDTYWPQFKGLKERLEGYLTDIADSITQTENVSLVNAGLVDNPVQAAGISALFKKKQVDIIFLYISTYALSSTVLPVVQDSTVPLVILNVQPEAAIDYRAFNAMTDRGEMTGEWLAHCQACCVPEIANVLNRAGRNYHLLTGHLQDGKVARTIGEWIDATRVSLVMRTNRLGLLGHYYGGMLDVYTDLTGQLAAFGGHLELMELDELREIRECVSADEIAAKRQEFEQVFDVAPECGTTELDRAAQTSVALDKLVTRHNLGSLAYYYEGRAESAHENIITSIIAGNTLLTGRHVPVAGEFEVKNAQAMKILDTFGAGGSFSEFYAMDFNDDIVMLGHDGPGHFTIAEGNVGLVPLPVYHGKPGKGLSIQMSVKHGPVTLLAIVDGTDGVFLLIAEGMCVEGPVLQIGNTNSRYKFSLSAADFIEQWSLAGPSHHCAIGIGHLGSRLTKLGKILGIPVKQIYQEQ